jgi:hypothetical protein
VQVTIAAAMPRACKAGYSFVNQALRSKPFAYKEGDVLLITGRLPERSSLARLG